MGTPKATTTECGGTGDSDGDGLQNDVETCGWGTNPYVVHSHGDGLSDCREVGDVDGNGAATISDVTLIARAALISSPPTKSGDLDLDKSRSVTISDVVLASRIALVAGLCP